MAYKENTESFISAGVGDAWSAVVGSKVREFLTQ